MSSTKKVDVLEEASLMLAKPGRDTRRKILIAVNLTFISALLLHLLIQLVEFGTLPDPGRDMVLFPLMILINSLSAIYNLRVLLGKRELNVKSDKRSTWFTLGISMLLALLFVHTNPNTATSMLTDFGFSVILIFVVGVLAGRKAAIVWFLVSGLSLFLAYQNIGSGFEYHLLTQEEVALFNEQISNNDPAATSRISELEQAKLKPLPVGLYASVWFIFMLIAFLATYFESNMISKILNAIPAVISKITIASEEKNQLQNENLRMGHELDVARQIQMLLLPKIAELNHTPYLEIAARMDPATEVGGDFYEVLPQKDGTVLLAMGDVTDHGLQSGLVMLMAQSTIRTVVDNQPIALTDAMNRINNVMFNNIRHRMEDHRNLTLSLARIEPDAITICGQHENMLHYQAKTNSLVNVSTQDLGMYVGLIEDIEPHVREKRIPLETQDAVLFFTDGLTEAENSKGEFYSEKRLERIFTLNAKRSASEILKTIYDDVYEFTKGCALLDDISIMVIKQIKPNLNFQA